MVFIITALFMLPGVAMTLLVSEPHRAAPPKTLREAVVEPFHEFITRQGWGSALLILAFLLFYKLGDSMCTALATPFYLDMGFSKSDIGLIAKNAGLWPSVIGGMLGGLGMGKIGINRALWLFGVVQLVSIFGFGSEVRLVFRSCQGCRPVAVGAPRHAGRVVDGEDRHQPRAVAVRRGATGLDFWFRVAGLHRLSQRDWRVGAHPAGSGHRAGGIRRGAGYRGLRCVHRAHHSPGLHRHAVRAVYQPDGGAAYLRQCGDRLVGGGNGLDRVFPAVRAARAARDGAAVEGCAMGQGRCGTSIDAVLRRRNQSCATPRPNARLFLLRCHRRLDLPA